MSSWYRRNPRVPLTDCRVTRSEAVVKSPLPFGRAQDNDARTAVARTANLFGFDGDALAEELVQTDWPTGDYRTKDVAVELSANGKTWREAGRGALVNRPGAVLRLALPRLRFAAVRLRFLSTHDEQAALSVGLAKLRFLATGPAKNPGAVNAHDRTSPKETVFPAKSDNVR